MPLDSLPGTIGNQSFHPSIPNLQLGWDSTSLSVLKECPRKYQYSILEGWQPRRLSVHLTFGLHYHSALERYDHLRVSGLDHEEALHSAIAWLLEATWDKAMGRPWISDHREKNRLTLVRTVVWYLDQFQDDPMVTVRLASGKPAVELSFRMELGFGYEGQPFMLCGHMDRVASLGDQTWVLDRKTTGTTINADFFSKFSPDNQFSAYMFAAKVMYSLPVNGLIVDGAQVAGTFSRFLRGPVYRSDDQLDEWHKDTMIWIAHATQYALDGYWPQNDKSCGLYGGCQFRHVCARPASTRQTWLEAEFERRVWDPMVVRGDI